MLMLMLMLALALVLERDDALSGLLRTLRDLELDDSALGELANEMSVLRQKLPPDVLNGDDPFDPTNPAVIKESLDDIKDFLINRLMSVDL
ncbi:MAG: hypothetical protein P8176_15865, partial [Gammaproteobacteria bacterium]